MAVLVVDRAAYEAVLDHAVADAPREACGVLAGYRVDDRRVVESAIRMRNNAAAPRVEYRIDETDLLAVVDELEAAGRRVVGFYHSHPAGPPTPTDRDQTDAHWSDHHYCVVSLTGSYPQFDAWRWTGKRFQRDSVMIDA